MTQQTESQFPNYNNDDHEDTLTDEDIREISRRAAKDAADQTRDIVVAENERNYDDMTADGDLDVHAKVDSMIEQIKKSEGLDIFEDVGGRLAEVYHFVKYQIKRNGEILATKTHPYSWTDIQKEFGGGSYQVTAKSEDNKYIKTQTQRVAPPTPGSEPTKEEKKSTSEMSAFDILAMMEKNKKESEEAAEKRAARDRETLMTMLTALKPDDSSTKEMMNLMQSKSDDTLKLMIAFMSNMKPEAPKDTSLEMMKFMMEMQNQARNETRMMLEKMSENTNRVLEQVMVAASSKDDPEFSPLKVFEMVEAARNQGVESYKQVTELAEIMAQKSKGESGKNESVLDAIIKSAATTLPQLMALKNPATTAAVPPNAQPRRTLPPGQARNASAPRNDRARLPETADRGRKGATTTHKNAPADSPTSAHIRKSASADPSGFPSALDFLDTEENTVETTRTTAEAVIVEPEADSGTMVNEEHKALIIQTAVPVVIECYQQGKRVNETVALTITAFRQNGIDLSRVPVDFLDTDVEEIITGYNLATLGEGLDTLLREYYAELVKTISKLRQAA